MEIFVNKENLLKLIKQGEGISVEFKKSKRSLNKDVFETVCAFLNRNGGHIFLGVDDDGRILGVEQNSVDKIIDNFVTQCNNPQKLFPPYYLNPQKIILEEKIVIYIFVPESSLVHSLNGVIFDRNHDGDFNVSKNSNHISMMYLRKQSSYTENIIYPYATLEDLDAKLINIAKIRAKNENGGNHPWFEMNNLEFLKSAQLYKKDFQTGKKGITLAGILLFGKDETILNVLPHHQTDAILRQNNLDRYDDRDDIRTNLIDTYKRLMSFVEKHLPDPFYMEEDSRVSLRNKIFREAVSNIIIHREYTSAFPAKMIIENEKVVFENANRVNKTGNILPNNFTPFPKNPIIAKVFKEIGFADELGSGVRNIFKYTKHYSKGNSPRIMEEDIFKIIIPIPTEPEGFRLEDGGLNSKVEGLNPKVEGLNSKVEGINPKVEGINPKVEGLNPKVEGLISKITNREDIRDKLRTILRAIIKNEGERIPQYVEITGFSKKTLERYIALLKKHDLVIYEGNSKKTGGYFFNKKFK